MRTNVMKWILSICLMLWGASAFAEDKPTLYAGAAKVEVTPPLGYPMWGYANRHDKPSVGVLDPLYARAVVLTIDNQSIGLVSLDLGRAPTRDVMKRIREAVQKTGISHLFIVGSHTHHGPVLEMDSWPDPKKPYTRDLQNKLIDVLRKAHKHRKPARLQVGAKQIPMNRNRQSKLPNAPTDHELLVMRVEQTDGSPIAHLVNFAAHPTMIPSSVRKFSADWPGAMATKMEKETKVPCLFLQGAAGDLSPNPGKHRGPKEFGEAVADVVLKLIKEKKLKTVDAKTVQVKEDDFRFKSRVEFDNFILRIAFRKAFFPELVAFYEREYREGVRPHLTTALLGEKIAIVGASGEFFCGHSLSLKRRARVDHVFFLGYCNDYQQYFPTIEAAGEGGYGADAMMSPAEVGAGEQMINRALIHLYRMRGKMKNLPPKE